MDTALITISIWWAFSLAALVATGVRKSRIRSVNCAPIERSSSIRYPHLNSSSHRPSSAPLSASGHVGKLEVHHLAAAMGW
jgi:hypothetical protein